MFFAFWCGLSVMFGVMGMFMLANYALDNVVSRACFAICLFLVIFPCISLGWILADEKHANQKDVVEKEEPDQN